MAQAPEKRGTPLQSYIVNEIVLRRAATAMIGLQHPDRIDLMRNVISNYLAALKAFDEATTMEAQDTKERGRNA